MTFLKERKRSDNILRRIATTKPSPVVLALLTAVVSVGGYVMFLAVLAPEQLAEATVTASDVVCSGCVGNTDIAPNAVGSGKIADGQVKAADIATDAVTSAEIGSSQVGSSEVANNAVNTAEIADGQVFGSDIAAVTITSSDLADSAITSSKLAGGAVKPNVHVAVDGAGSVPPGGVGSDRANCPAGEILTGGGFNTPSEKVRVKISVPLDSDTWYVEAFNEGSISHINVYAICIGPSP